MAAPKPTPIDARVTALETEVAAINNSMASLTIGFNNVAGRLDALEKAAPVQIAVIDNSGAQVISEGGDVVL